MIIAIITTTTSTIVIIDDVDGGEGDCDVSHDGGDDQTVSVQHHKRKNWHGCTTSWTPNDLR